MWPALILGAALLGASLPSEGQISSSEEYRLKLAFLFNFAKFVEWPPYAFPSPQAPLNICIVGRDPFDAEFERQVTERNLYGHPVTIRTLRANDGLGGCHLIFLPASSDGSLPGVLRLLDGSAITVGESAGFVTRGGVLSFLLEGTNLRFTVNLNASQRTRCRISSRFLALAKIYKE
ncbi:MAG TPA: YfiR family protein [Terriglobales bacterium]